MVLAGMLLLACTTRTNGSATTDTASDRTEVVYFHGKQRCATCMAIEQLAREVVEKDYAAQVADGTLALRVVDISQPENAALAERYEVTWSSLFVVDKKGCAVNLTDMAFGNARSNPDQFRKELHGAIDKSLR